MRNTFKNYLIIAVILFVMTRVYGLFAHGVSSLAMESTAWIAVLGGFVLIPIKRTLNEKAASGKWFIYSYNVSLALLINYLFVQGVLTIAGGSSSMDFVFIGLSSVFALMCLVLWIFNRWTFKKSVTYP